VGTGLATGVAIAGCGADAAGLCAFNVCTPQSIVGLNDGSAPQDATMGGEGSVNGSEAGAPDGGMGDGGGGGGDAGSETGPLPDGSCGNPSLTYCGPGAGCVDTTGSAANCGMCGNQCPTPTNATATCDASTCGFACDSTHFLCDGGCDSTSAPPSDTCVLNETFGVFVSPTGVDALGNGTRAAPYASIGYAIQNAKGAPRVYVCTGSYDETINLGAGTTALTIYGGFGCATPTTWTYAPATYPVKVQPTAGVPLTIAGTSATLTFEDIEFDAPKGASEGASSIATIVSAATGAVGFTNCTLVADTGAAGANGQTPSTALPPATGGGSPDTGSNNGGAAVLCTCPYGTQSVGGSGGTGGISPTDGSNGTPGSALNKGTGGTGGPPPKGCTNAAPGVDAPANPGDGPGASALGAISGTTWTPGSGQVGTGGATGQGGGGGGGGYAAIGNGNGGGGGGCGGCGGGGGGPGEGGGASLGSLVVGSSVVSFTNCTIKTAAAGNGGNGAGGQNGESGGGKGTSMGVSTGCNGGAGGAGAKGGAGGGGAGGISAGVAWKGSEPSFDSYTQTHITIGTAGSKGSGGNSPTNDGVAGASGVTLMLP
jgi:hypothetical protein